MRHFRLLSSLFFVAAILFSGIAHAKIDIKKYGVVADTLLVKQQTVQAFDSMLKATPLFGQATIVSYVAKIHPFENNTIDFYLLLGLCFLLGAIKTIHPKYFNDVWRAFINPTLGSRQLKDMIQAATIPNMLMNLFSSVVIGCYIFYLISVNRDWRFSELPSSLVISLLVVLVIIIYLCKYLFINFTGWAFNINPTTDQYNFNVFLVNKVIGMLLLPFVVGFAFLNSSWDVPLTICSVFVLVALLLNRYIRSWNIFAPFFLNSRFHFFMYLCAFEISPMAVLMKLVIRML